MQLDFPQKGVFFVVSGSLPSLASLHLMLRIPRVQPSVSQPPLKMESFLHMAHLLSAGHSLYRHLHTRNLQDGVTQKGLR